MAYTDIDDPTAYFQAKKYVGTGGSQAYTFDGNSDLQANFLWFKSTDLAQEHWLADSVRGTTKYLESNSTNAEATSASGLSSFDSNGFTFGSDIDRINGDGHNYVGWGWKAGTSFTNDASATGIGTIDSAGSVNDTAGFSIVSYTSTGSNGSIKHGLSTAPSMIIFKRRSGDTENWPVYHQALGNTHFIKLNSTDAQSDSATRFNDTSPTSSVFTVGTSGDTNGGTSPFIAYCFAEKKGYSKFGSYKGNNDADGPFIYLGFKPAFLIMKETSGTGNWAIIDSTRSFHNVGNHTLASNLDDREDQFGGGESVNGDSNKIDLVSNGFKIREASAYNNGSGDDYIYMAFAENPFVTSTGIPTTAR